MTAVAFGGPPIDADGLVAVRVARSVGAVENCKLGS
jgi:hypothetical protein